MTPPGTDSCSIHRFFIYMKDEFERLFYPKRKKSPAEKWIVMPSHIHMILVLQEQAAPLPALVGQYKSYVTRKIHEMYPILNVWQRHFMSM